VLVRDRMSAPPITIDIKTPLSEAHALMRHYHIRRLPVLARGRLVGIVSWTDLMRAQPSPASTLSPWEAPGLLRRTSVQEIMTANPITIGPDEPIEAAAVILRLQKIGGLPVVAGSLLVGVITESDVFEAFLDMTGFRAGGTRFVVDLTGQAQALARIAEVAETAGATLTSLAAYPKESRRLAVLRVTSDQPERFAQALGRAGFQVEHVAPVPGSAVGASSSSRPQ
jgi:acetoin utilization protein AcuB